MKILKLTLNNFGPYFGTQSLDLDVSDNAPIILVYGENERGKTSLLRAIRWCLYGEVLNQGGTLMDEREFANYDARDRKEPFDVFVEIEFEDHGYSYFDQRNPRLRIYRNSIRSCFYQDFLPAG